MAVRTRHLDARSHDQLMEAVAAETLHTMEGSKNQFRPYVNVPHWLFVVVILDDPGYYGNPDSMRGVKAINQKVCVCLLTMTLVLIKLWSIRVMCQGRSSFVCVY